MKKSELPSIILIEPDSQSQAEATRLYPVIDQSVELSRVDATGNRQVYEPNTQVWMPDDRIGSYNTDETDEFDTVV